MYGKDSTACIEHSIRYAKENALQNSSVLKVGLMLVQYQLTNYYNNSFVSL